MFLQLSTYSSPVDVAVREVRQFNPLYIVYSWWVESILVDDRTLLTEIEAVAGCVCNTFYTMKFITWDVRILYYYKIGTPF